MWSYAICRCVYGCVMNNTNSEVANRIRKALNDEGYTQTEVAKRLNLSRGQTSRILSGKSTIKFEHMAAIGRFLNINPTEFLGIKPEPDSPLMTVPEAAEYTARHPETIRKCITRGELKSFQRCARGTHRIRRSDLNAWLAGAR